jgi:HEAT repeats
MRPEELKIDYESVKELSDPIALLAFVRKVMSSEEPAVLELHYRWLHNKRNERLYLFLRGAFVKRGKIGEKFLVERAREESDPAMQADILTILGGMHSPAALPMARRAVDSNDKDMRYRGCYVLGWLGEEVDISRLRERLLKDEDPKVRSCAAATHYQFYIRAPEFKLSLLKNLRDGLITERDDIVAKWIVSEVQDILGKSFGLKEDFDESEVLGDLQPAREKCMRALAKLDL